MLGLKPLHGRLLDANDDRVGGPRVAVLSATVWQQHFGADPSLVGQAIMLNSEPYTVVGIAPPGFRFSGPHSTQAEVWVPFAVGFSEYQKLASNGRGDHFLSVMGRRKQGVSLDQAQAELSTIADRLATRYPDTNTKVGVIVEDLHDALVGRSRQSVWVLFAAVSLVFLVVCANVASLLLARASSRRVEMATRVALGATRVRLGVQLLTETLVVFLLGSVGGALLAHWFVDLISAGIIVKGGVSTINVSVDNVALAFSVGSCLLCGILFGLVPAFEAARVQPQAVLVESAVRAGVPRSQRTVRGLLVVAQVALAFALLVGSGLSLQAFWALSSTPPGFEPNHLATTRISLPESKYQNSDQKRAFYRDLISRVSAQPGVTSVAANSYLPMAGWNNNGSFQIQARPAWPAGSRPVLERNFVTPGYFRTMGIPLMRGRDFNEADSPDSPRVMIISQATAERFFAGSDPIGQRLSWDPESDNPDWYEIIGIVGDVRRRGLGKPIAAETYMSLMQRPRQQTVLVARSERAEGLLPELPALVQKVDPEQAVASLRLMSDRVADSVGPQRFMAGLLGGFAAVALLLATVGIFGLVSFTTSQRTRELGIRMALGSTPSAALRLVMRGGLRLLGVGLALGLFGAIAVGQALANRIAAVQPFDMLVYGLTPLILAAVGTAACLVPAWRAVRIPPATALRYE